MLYGVRLQRNSTIGGAGNGVNGDCGAERDAGVGIRNGSDGAKRERRPRLIRERGGLTLGSKERTELCSGLGSAAWVTTEHR